MIYKFLTDEDISSQIKNDILADILPGTDDRQKKIAKAEAAALKQIRAKAGRWYNMDIVLQTLKQWQETYFYPAGSFVYDEGVIYKAKTDTTAAKPIESGTEWTPDDPRHELLVMYATDMVLYHLHSLVNPRKIPDLRKDRYHEAKDWLEMIAERNENADFPENELDEELLIWGSNPKIETYI